MSIYFGGQEGVCYRKILCSTMIHWTKGFIPKLRNEHRTFCLPAAMEIILQQSCANFLVSRNHKTIEHSSGMKYWGKN